MNNHDGIARDIIILAELRTAPMSGYDVISFIHCRFHTPHKLRYSPLNSILLRKKRTKRRKWNERKRVYELMEKKGKKLETLLNANGKIKNVTANILKVQFTS